MTENVVIIGRPNAGKSTLFNRLLGKRKALVHHEPGTTRDCNEALISLQKKSFNLIDTGGWWDDGSFLSKEVKNQMETALSASSIIIFLVDGKNGFHPLDQELNNIIRKHQKRVILVVNKVDSEKDEAKSFDFYRLGIKELITISAIHGRNVYELTDKIHGYLKSGKIKPSKQNKNFIKIAFVGKPNVGKSSLFNTLYKQKRNIVDETPGTTREAVDIEIKKDEQHYILIDTPGLKRKRIFKNDMEYLSTLSTQKALGRADVAILIIDAQQGIGETDAKISELVLKSNCACLIAINKWDVIENKEERIKLIKGQLEQKLQFLWWSKITFISAKTSLRTEKMLDEVKNIYGEYSKKIQKERLRDLIYEAQQKNPLNRKGINVQIREIEQTDVCPPGFTFTVNNPELVHFSYRRYLENKIREAFGFTGTPLILKFQKRGVRACKF
ncbi:MAG: ribosome biogenesis GTPase Der [Endomicrobiales bacterium]|nr:ribosome biogenesis GTPase Der [Endomicrobiales bacterium]